MLGRLNLGVITGAIPVSDSFILDQVTALYGYSLRKLRTTATKAIRVRRSSDNAEQDIAFSGEDIDETSLLAFVGAGDGFVVEMYNQVDDGATSFLRQSSQGSQPTIVESGVVNKVNGKATINFYFGAASKSLSLTLPAQITQPLVVNHVIQAQNIAFQRPYIGGIFVQLTSSGQVSIVSGSTVSTGTGVVDGTLQSIQSVFNYPNGSIHVNGTQEATGSLSSNTNMTTGTLNQLSQANMSEFIILPDSSFNSTLNTNQQSYYAIT